MSSITQLQKKIVEFRDKRDWKQFHNPKDLSLSLILEATEVAEHFQYRTNEEMQEYVKKSREKIGEELADTLYWVLLLAYDTGVDIENAFQKKMKKNAQKYPTKTSKGKHTNKYR